MKWLGLKSVELLGLNWRDLSYDNDMNLYGMNRPLRHKSTAPHDHGRSIKNVSHFTTFLLPVNCNFFFFRLGLITYFGRLSTIKSLLTGNSNLIYKIILLKKIILLPDTSILTQLNKTS